VLILHNIYHLPGGLNGLVGYDNEEENARTLSFKEKEILRWVRFGKNTAEIATILEISKSTVKFHISNILEKLNAVNRTHAVAIAIEKNLLD